MMGNTNCLYNHQNQKGEGKSSSDKHETVVISKFQANFFEVKRDIGM